VQRFTRWKFHGLFPGLEVVLPRRRKIESGGDIATKMHRILESWIVECVSENGSALAPYPFAAEHARGVGHRSCGDTLAPGRKFAAFPARISRGER
jgi:hypothetical protein